MKSWSLARARFVSASYRATSIFFFFFFKYRGTPRDLPFSPPRRSPDREGIEVPIIPLTEFPEHADLAVECAPAAILERICRPMLGAGKQVMVLSCGALLMRSRIAADRKSTRLNSSHLVISYAVFCLTQK